MKPHILFFVFLLSLFPASVFAASPLSLREELLSSVVQIVSMTEDGEVFIGSGTVIRDDGLILTNHHVVSDKGTGEYYPGITLCFTVSEFESPKCVATGKVLASTEQYDLGLVLPDKKIGKNGKPTKISFQKYWQQSGNTFYVAPFKNPFFSPLPHILDSITAWGYPALGGSTITVTSGLVSGFSSIETAGNEAGAGEDSFIKFIKTDTQVSPGNSGGAAFNQYFSFIGVPSNAFPGELGFIVPVEAVVQWLQSLDDVGVLKLDSIQSMYSYSHTFRDLNEDLNDIALLLRHLNITKGYDDDTFRPEQYLTRAEAIKILMQLKRVRITDPAAEQQCQQIGDWQLTMACYARNLGWITDKRYNPHQYITEKEFTVMFSRLFGFQRIFTNSENFVSRGDMAYKLFDFIGRR